MTGNIRMLRRQIVWPGKVSLTRLAIERKRCDARAQNLVRETYNPGDDAAHLFTDPGRSRAFRMRKFRPLAVLRSNYESLIEICAGKTEGGDAESQTGKEATEENGFCAKSARFFAADKPC
ncbi:MAG: hypothetical protein ACRED2_03415 [Methylocella sp.]